MGVGGEAMGSVSPHNHRVRGGVDGRCNPTGDRRPLVLSLWRRTALLAEGWTFILICEHEALRLVRREALTRDR